MGMFKQMKDMKAMVQAAPEMVQAAQAAADEAQRLAAAQAQQAAAAQQIAGAQQTTGSAAGSLEPIAGVSLERYAEVSRGLAAYGYDSAMAPTVAAGFGISADDWQTAMEGWNERIASDPAIARAFNQAYTGR